MNWNKKAMRLNADAIHINTNMRVPSSAWMFNSYSVLVKTPLKMENMTVATTDATMVKRAVMKESTRKGRERRRMNVRRRWAGWDWFRAGSEDRD